VIVLGEGNGAMEELKMEQREPDGSGRRHPTPVKVSEFKLECDRASIAVGAGANPLLTKSTEGLKLNTWSCNETEPCTSKTRLKKEWPAFFV